MTINVSSHFSERSRLDDRAQDLLDRAAREGRGLTSEEQSEFDAATDRIATINMELTAAGHGPGQRVTVDPADPAAAAMAALAAPIPPLGSADSAAIAAPLASGRTRAFPNTAKGHEAAYRSGQWARANFLHHPGAIAYCQRNGLPFTPYAALGEGVNPSGGSLIPDELSRAVIEQRDTYGLFRQAADVVPMTSDSLVIPRRTGGLTAIFVGENQEGTESDASWDNVRLSAKKIMCLTRMSTEVSEDAVINLADKLAQEVGLAFAMLEDQCGLLGDGTSTYGGMVGVLVAALQAAHSKAKVAAASTHKTFATLDADDLLALMGAVPLYARAGSAWFCSPTCKTQVIDAIKIAGGGNTASQLAALQTDTFMGYPVYQTPLMNDTAGEDLNGKVMLGFGNLRMAATLGSRRGIAIALSGERWFELDQVGLRGTERFDIVAHDLGSTTVKSPFAVLVGTT